MSKEMKIVIGRIYKDDKPTGEIGIKMHGNTLSISPEDFEKLFKEMQSFMIIQNTLSVINN